MVRNVERKPLESVGSASSFLIRLSGFVIVRCTPDDRACGLKWHSLPRPETRVI
jgi:hypothetical protein